jgi:DNA-binding CsgD family transcriptional regulator/PAS domain-containing protein
MEAERSIMDVWETDISACIGGIYEAACHPAAWPAAVESLRRLFHGSTACLARTGPDLRPSDAIAPNNDPVFQHRYIHEFADEQNVVEAALARAPVGLVYNDIAYIGPKKLRDSRLWNDWMAPQDMYGGLTSKLLASGQSSWSFDVQRGRGQSEFDGREVKFLELLSPHLRRAIEINRQNEMAELYSSVLSHLPFGVVLVDASLRILSLNDAAESLLSECPGALYRKMGLFAAADPAREAGLRRLVAEACSSRDGVAPGSGGDLLIHQKLCGGGAPTLAISVRPLTGSGLRAISSQPCAVIILRKVSSELPAGFVEDIRRVFDLTPREANLAASLAAGLALKDIARDMGIRFSTARTHLDRIFRKTETRQQSQLVAVLKNVQPVWRRA